MVEQASKANKSVVDDAAIEEFIGTSKKEMAAEYTDKASQVLFPLSFVVFNVVYWVYFSVAGWKLLMVASTSLLHIQWISS